MNGYVHFDADGDIAVIRIDNPPVNAGSIEVRSGILRSIERVAADPALKAAILIGVGKTFIAGSDLREFGQPLASPTRKSPTPRCDRGDRGLPETGRRGVARCGARWRV